MLNVDKEPKAYEQSLGEGKADQSYVHLYGENINLIDLRQQSSGQGDEPIGIQYDGRARNEDNNLLARETLQHFQNQNLMDLQLATNSKINSGAYKR